MPFEAQPIADARITKGEYDKSGCPVCKSGEKMGYVLAQTNKEVVFSCAKCGVAYIVTF